MNCPKCDSNRVLILTTRKSMKPGENTLTRMRICRACDTKFVTLEQVVGFEGQLAKRKPNQHKSHAV